jgi:hypothetical protein
MDAGGVKRPGDGNGDVTTDSIASLVVAIPGRSLKCPVLVIQYSRQEIRDIGQAHRHDIWAAAWRPIQNGTTPSSVMKGSFDG